MDLEDGNSGGFGKKQLGGNGGNMWECVWGSCGQVGKFPQRRERHVPPFLFGFLIFFYYGKIYIKFTILIVLDVQFSVIKYIDIIVQPSPLSISGTFASSQTETPYPLNNNSRFSLPQPLINPNLLLVCMNLTTLDTSYARDRILFPSQIRMLKYKSPMW